MAVVTTKSTVLQNQEGTTANSGHDTGGRIRVAQATLEVAAGDDDDSVFRFFRVGSGWSLISVKVFHDSITGGTDYDLGLYAVDDGAVVDADVYADGVSLATGTVVGTELRYNDTTTADVNKVGNKVWEDAGLSSDPNLEYDLALTANTVGSAAGTITIVALYTDGS